MLVVEPIALRQCNEELQEKATIAKAHSGKTEGARDHSKSVNIQGALNKHSEADQEGGQSASCVCKPYTVRNPD